MHPSVMRSCLITGLSCVALPLGHKHLAELGKGNMLDRSAQLSILETLAEAYPHEAKYMALEERIGARPYEYNLSYLIDLGLVEGERRDIMGGGILFIAPKITAKGLDFLQDDGGISAILNTITVRLHDDTIRQLLLDRVEKSSEPPDVKERMKEAIRSAPASALSQVTEEAVKVGLERLPGLIGTLSSWISS